MFFYILLSEIIKNIIIQQIIEDLYMLKKSFTLLTTLILFNISSTCAQQGYPAEQGYQAIPHNEHHSAITEKAREADLRRLNVLEQEERDEHFLTNLALAGVATGVIMTFLAWNKNYSSTTIGAGLTFTGVSGAGGYVAKKDSKYRAKERKKERSEIQKRLNNFDHHHNNFGHHHNHH
jgi:hypothetical protein